MKRNLFLKFIFAAFACVWCRGNAQAVEPPPNYVSVEGVEGSLEVFGHRSLETPVAVLAKAFGDKYPWLKVTVESSHEPGSFGDGARAAKNPVFMIEGEASPHDLARMKLVSGNTPLEVNVFAYAVYVVVNKSNPLNEISTDLLKSLYFGTGDLTWGGLGVSEQEWSNKKVSIHGMGDMSMYTFLLRDKLGVREKFSDTMIRSRGVDDLLRAVQANPNAIGFAGHASSAVKILAIRSSNKEASGVSPPSKTAGPNYGAGYPFLRIAKLHSNQGAENRVHLEFLKFVLSKDGLEIIARDTFALPLEEANYRSERIKLEKN